MNFDAELYNFDQKSINNYPKMFLMKFFFNLLSTHNWIAAHALVSVLFFEKKNRKKLRLLIYYFQMKKWKQNWKWNDKNDSNDSKNIINFENCKINSKNRNIFLSDAEQFVPPLLPSPSPLPLSSSLLQPNIQNKHFVILIE